MAAPAQAHPVAEETIVPVPFTEDAYAAIRELARERGKPVPAAIRDAINLAWYLYRALDEVGRIVIERPEGRREILTKR
jgi:hypothetical protein